MPRSTREWALRKLISAINNVDWCDKHLVEVADKYAYLHPNISAGLLYVMGYTKSVKDLIAVIRKEI